MSTPQYFQVGSPLRDPIILENPDGTFVTGKVQGDFTIRLSKDGVGNQATTGIAIAETSAANNPGQYEITCSTSGFIAVQGNYTLTITLTATPSFTFEQTYIINNTATSGGAGAAFTATAGNGRIMYGGVPLPNATIIVTNGAGSVIATTTSSALGLWGPIYFVANGTYTATAQISGYASSTATITVTGAPTTATLSPASDITMTATTVNALSASELWAYFTRQARDVSGTKSTTERVQGVQDAVDMVIKASKWSWLLRRAYLTINGYQTITVGLTANSTAVTFVTSTSVASVGTIVGGTGYSGPTFNVTFTGGGGSGAQGTANVIAGAVVSVTMVSGGTGYTSAPTPVFTAGAGTGASGVAVLLTAFPSWTGSGRMLIESQVLDVASLTNGTNAVLAVAYAGQTKNVAAILFQDQYDLPDSMLWVHKIIPFQRWGWGGEPCSAETFYEMQAAVVYQQRFPGKYCIHNGALMMYPYPQTTDTLCYTYYIRPPALVNSADILDWDPAQIDVIRRACDLQVCYRYGSYAGGDPLVAEQRYREALALAIESARDTTNLPGAMSDSNPWDQRLSRTDWHRRQGL